MVQILNALQASSLLFLISVGLTLIFGILGVINFAHGAFYMLGAYVGYSMMVIFHNFWLALILAPLIVGAVGVLLEITTLRYIYARDPIYQFLLTFGFALILEEVVKIFWGWDSLNVDLSGWLATTVEVVGVRYPVYRLFLSLLGIGIALVLWLFLHRTKLGLVVRAVAQNSEMASAVGIDIQVVRSLVFGVSSALAAIGGVVAAPILSAFLGMGVTVIVDAFVVVVVGGLGSVVGSIVGSLVVGSARTWGSYILPEVAMAIIYATMGCILIFRPHGLFGEEE
jgi:branched-chain amino acid transport system permease protein